jgi:hypothetical protein
LRNTVAALIAALSIATYAIPASAAPAKAPQIAACEQVMKGETADVDCTITKSIAQDTATEKGSQYPEAPTNIGGGVWF